MFIAATRFIRSSSGDVDTIYKIELKNSLSFIQKYIQTAKVKSIGSIYRIHKDNRKRIIKNRKNYFPKLFSSYRFLIFIY